MVDGYCFPHLVRRLDVAGQQVTQYLLDLLRRRGYAFNLTTDLHSLQQMKERVCYVACDYQREVQVLSVLGFCILAMLQRLHLPACCTAPAQCGMENGAGVLLNGECAGCSWRGRRHA